MTSTVVSRPEPIRDSLTMLRRNLRHMRSYPSMTLMLMGQPIIFLLLFVYVFGGTLGHGISGGGRTEYLGFIAPSILVMTVASVALGTAVSVASDMTGGIVDRFRTMAVARVSILTGHVLGALIQTVIAVVVSTVVALGLGYRSPAGPGGWLAAAGLLVMFAFALTWFTVALGLVARSPETASNTPIVLVLLPFLGSGFVPTDSMPTGLRWFAEYQPFTPVMNSVRGLLGDGAAGHDVLLAVVWSVGIAIVGYAWSRRLYNKRSGQ